MRVELRVFPLSLYNGATPKRFFKKVFELPALPKTGWVVPPGFMVSNPGRLKTGVVKDVNREESPPWIWVGIETAETEMAGILTSEEGFTDSLPID